MMHVSHTTITPKNYWPSKVTNIAASIINNFLTKLSTLSSNFIKISLVILYSYP